METAPTTTAHAHLRSAASATTTTAAIDQHRAAATDFSAACSTTSDPEALRILSLLEAHHIRLAQILKDRSEQPQVQSKAPSDPPGSPVSQDVTSNKTPPVASATPTDSTRTIIDSPPSILQSQTQTHSARDTRSSRSHHPAPPRQHNHNPPPRDLSSSIALNLAAARGIPSHSSSSPSAQRRPGAPHQKSGSAAPQSSISTATATGRPSHVPPSDIGGKDRERPHSLQQSAQPHSQEPFNRFFNTFESLFARLSSPLAFAGLPLDPDDLQTGNNATPISAAAGGPGQTGKTKNDFSDLFSRAALRAVTSTNPDAQPPFTADAAGNNIHDSFYVVPATGGTVSYAGMASRTPQAQAQVHSQPPPRPRNPSTDDTGGFDDADDFVDAPSSPQAAQHGSPSAARHASSGQGRTGKTQEELELENESLKQLTDQLSVRLYAWEKDAQTRGAEVQAHANAQAAKPGSQGGDSKDAKGEGAGEAQESDKDAELASLRTKMAEMEAAAAAQAKENEKLKGVVVRYRERWEKLKEGARGRRTNDGKSGGAEGDGKSAKAEE